MEVMNNAPALRFNGIQTSLVSWQGLWLGTRLNRKPAALLKEMACRRLSAAGFAGVAELCNTLAQRFRQPEQVADVLHRWPECGGVFCKILHVRPFLQNSARSMNLQNFAAWLDGGEKTLQYQATGFNQPRSFDRLECNGRQAATPERAAFLRLQSLAPCARFSMAGRGWGGLAPAGSLRRPVNPALCLPPPRLTAWRWPVSTVTRGHTMSKIRKGYSRPLISRKIRSFDTLAEAGRFIDRLTAANRNDYAFNIIQQDGRWTVCNVISGEVQS